MCAMPFGGLTILLCYMWIGRTCYNRTLAKGTFLLLLKMIKIYLFFFGSCIILTITFISVFSNNLCSLLLPVSTHCLLCTLSTLYSTFCLHTIYTTVHRKCIMTGKEVTKPMTSKFYLATRLRVANSTLGNVEFGTAKARQQALKNVMNHNRTSLPVGSFVIRTCELKRADQVRTLSRSELSVVLQHNITAFRTSVIERLEYLRFTNKIWKLFFWFLLLIYPSLSTRVLRTFACTQIGKVYVLRFDRSVECYTWKYYAFSFGAAGAGVLFVAGIPFLFYFLLWKARNRDITHQWYDCEKSPKRLTQVLKEAEEDAKIMREHWVLDKDGDGDPTLDEKKHAVVKYFQRKNMRFHRTYERLGFLYYSYNETHWWYEMVELSRKLILNGVIVLVPEAVTARVMVGLLTCLFYCKLLLLLLLL